MEDTQTESAPNPADAAREAALAAFDEVVATPDEGTVAAAPEPTIPAPVAPPAEPPPVPNPAEVAVAEKLAELVRAESALVAKQQAMKADADEARAKARAAEEKLAAIEAQLAENPMELLRARKWELEDIVKVAATKQTPEAVRIAKLEAKIAERDAEAARAAEAAKVAGAQSEAEQARAKLINEYIPAQLAIAKDELPLCSKWFEPDELAREVYAVMGHEYARTKTALEPAEAARRVEAALRKRVEKVNPSSPVTQESASKPKTSKPTVKPSATVTNTQTQHRTTSDERVQPGDLEGYRRQAAALFDELVG